MNTAKSTSTAVAVERWMDEGGSDLPRKDIPVSASEPDGADTLLSLKDKLSAMDQTLRGFVKERPLAATAVALSVGYLLGRLLGRR